MTSDLDLLKVNKFVLRKQKLAGGEPGRNIVETVRAVGGLHATGATTPYLSCFARVAGFKREHLDHELYVKRNLGKIRYVRTTVYVLPKDMIPTAFAATRTMSEPASKAYSKFLGITEELYRKTSKRILEILEGKNGMTTKQIREALETPLNVSPIVNLMCDQGLLIRGAPEKGWKSNLHTYHLFNEYFPNMKLNETNEESARKTVILWYLASFGLATLDDVAWWIGFPKNQVRHIMESQQDEITYLNIPDLSKTFLMLHQDETSMKLTRNEEKHVINMLPSLDPYMMGYKDRERYMNLKHYDFVFDRGGNATSTILLNGKIIGIWDFKERVIKIFLFEDITQTLLEEISAKARSLGVFISNRNADVKECESMVPLTQRSAGGVVSPLKDC
jgi:hypothetical protein